ncbi:MAG: hypothetical protein JWQ45_2734 [Blastococcus sp.]|nr:hypothetical protein [Blastococcus sp.]
MAAWGHRAQGAGWQAPAMRWCGRTAAPGGFLVAVVAGSVLAGCGGTAPGGTPSASGSSTTPRAITSTQASPSGDDATEAAPFPADTSPDTQDASTDAAVTVTDVRLGHHEGFDRVVLEIDGAGTPGWDVRYVDVAVSQGRGEPVEVAGDATLQVTITGARYPFDTGVDEFANREPITAAGTEEVTEVLFDATYEGTTVAFVGTTTEAPFRVYAMQNPERVVVEVRDPA